MDEKTERMFQWTEHSRFDRATEIMVDLLQTEIHTNDF